MWEAKNLISHSSYYFWIYKTANISTINKTSILFILHLPPPVHGAANIGLSIKQSHLINTSFNCDYINLTTQASLQDMGKSNLKKVFILLRLYHKIIKTLIKKPYDLCYLTINSSGPGFYKELIIVFILKCFRQKIVYHYHNKGVKESSKKFLNNLLYKIQFRNSRAILLSSKLFYDVSKYLKPNHVYYCNNGIASINNLIVKKTREEAKPVILLFVSNMFIAKGVYILLEACRILAEKKISFTCNFIGAWATEITEENFIQISTEYGIADHVKAHGPKFDSEKLDYFSASDIFMLPTLNDVFPLVTLEAMQSGLPIISTNEGAIPEIVIDGHNGFIVPKNDPVALADKIITLINNKDLRKEMGHKGRHRFEELYTLPVFEENFKFTIEQVLIDFKLV